MLEMALVLRIVSSVSCALLIGSVVTYRKYRKNKKEEE